MLFRSVVFGCVSQVGEQALNVARNAWLAAGFPVETPATTVDRQCGSSQQAIHFAANLIQSGVADVTIFFGDGTSLTTNLPMPANSRVSIPVSLTFPAAMNKGGFGTIIQSNGLPIVVERAMYTNANGATWAAGTDALGTKLQ